MANQEHLDILKQGVEVWNQWREEYPDIRPDLSLAELDESILSEIDLSNTDLFQATFRRATLHRANLSAAFLHDAVFSEANLSEANLSEASLHGADLSGADLSEADLNRAFLMSARLSSPLSSEENYIAILPNGVTLNLAALLKADLSKININLANLSDTFTSLVNLTGVNLNQTDLKDLREASITIPGATKLVRANLSNAILNMANLSGADLTKANLSKAGLMSATLIAANMTSAILTQADLSYANLSCANLSYADLSSGPFPSLTNITYANLSGANLMGANLKGSLLAHSNLNYSNLNEADLTGAFIHGVSVWDVKLRNTIQSNLVVSLANEPLITVDNIEVAQFIYLLLQHKKLREVLNSVMKRAVLILGRFGGGGLEVLQAIAAKLREEGYLPILFDFERPQDRDYTETIMTLAGLSHFIIADLSGPSVPQELSHTVPFLSTPLVPIIEKGKKTYSMFPDFLKYPWVIKPPINFTSLENLQQLIPTKVIPLAEKKQQSRQKQLEKFFPRKQG